MTRRSRPSATTPGRANAFRHGEAIRLTVPGARTPKCSLQPQLERHRQQILPLSSLGGSCRAGVGSAAATEAHAGRPAHRLQPHSPAIAACAPWLTQGAGSLSLSPGQRLSLCGSGRLVTEAGGGLTLCCPEPPPGPCRASPAAGLTSAQGRRGGCADRADRVPRAGGSGDPRGSPWPHFGKRAPSGVPPPASASWAQFCALRMLLVPAVPTQPVLPLVRPPDSAAAGVLPAPLGAGVLLSPGQSGGVPGWYLCPACLPPRPRGRSSQRMPMEGAADLVTSTSEAGQRVSGAGACVGASALPRGVCRTQRRGAAGIRAAGRGSPWGVGGHTLALPVPEGSEGGLGTTDWQGQATTPLTPGGLVGAGGHSVGAGVPV